MEEIKINVDYLLQIAGDDRELVIGIINDFERESLELITELKGILVAGVGEGSLVDIGRILHKFRGSSSSLGMVSLSGVLVQLETWDLDLWRGGGGGPLGLSEHLTKSVELCKGALV